MIEAGDEEECRDPCVVVCQGPPICMLMGDEAMAAQMNGCVWCRRIWVHYDGSSTVREPARA